MKIKLRRVLLSKIPNISPGNFVFLDDDFSVGSPLSDEWTVIIYYSYYSFEVCKEI